MKPKDKILTYDQAKELKWFCGNVTGLRQDFYKVSDQVESFKNRFERLEKTAGNIESFLAKMELENGK